MQLHFPALAHYPALTAGLVAATTKKSSSSSVIFFVFLLIIVGAYFLFIAPQRRRMRAQMNQQATFQPGDEVVTKAGVFGRVRSTEGDRIRLDIAPGTTIEVMQNSILRRVDPVVAADEPASTTEDHEDDEGADGDLHWQTPEPGTAEEPAEAQGSSDWSGSWGGSAGSVRTGEESQSAGPS